MIPEANEAPRDITKSDAFVSWNDARRLAGAHGRDPRHFVAALVGVPQESLLAFVVEAPTQAHGYVVHRLRVRVPMRPPQ